jgi:hypothetical protein
MQIHTFDTRVDAVASGAAHGVLPARRQRAIWHCVQRSNGATVRRTSRHLQPVQAVLTVGSHSRTSDTSTLLERLPAEEVMLKWSRTLF